MQIECGCPTCNLLERNSHPEHCPLCHGAMVPIEAHGYLQFEPADVATDVPKAIEMLKGFGRFVVEARKYGLDGSVRVYFSGARVDYETVRYAFAVAAASPGAIRKMTILGPEVEG